MKPDLQVLDFTSRSIVKESRDEFYTLQIRNHNSFASRLFIACVVQNVKIVIARCKEQILDYFEVSRAQEVTLLKNLRERQET